MSDLSKYSKDVIAKFSKKITDEIFLFIQKDKVLMHRYLKLVEQNGLSVVNRHIGKCIKKEYKLKNHAMRQKQPKSTSYSISS